MSAVPRQPGPPSAGTGTYAGLERRRAPDAGATTARLTALSRAAARIVSARSVSQVAAVAVRAGVEAVGAGGGTVAVRDDTRQVVRLSSTDDYNPDLVGAWRELPLDAPLPISHTARTGERLLLQTREQALERFPDAARFQTLTDEGGSRIVAAAVVPLAAPTGLLGSFTLTWPTERMFAPEDLELLEALAVLVVQALERIAALKERERVLAGERLLARSGELLRAGLDQRAVLAATVDLVRPALGRTAWVRTARDGSVHGDTRGTGDATTGGSRAVTGLVADGEVLGTLVVVRPDGPPFDPDDRALLDQVAGRAALALSHAALFEEQRDTSIALQRALLTEPPEPNHLHVVVRYLPATHAAVGGDWYDAFISPDGATVLVIGDVVGYDAQAAARMGQLRGLLRGVAYVLDASPAQVLTATDRTASGLSVGALATAVVARLEGAPAVGTVRGRLLRWTNAGHLPPVVLGQDGAVTVLETEPELMLGVDPSAGRGDHEWPLVDGDTVLLYTDGLVERRGESLDVGLGALVDALAAVGPVPPDALCDALLDRLLPQGAEDDVALVAVRLYP